MELLGQLMINGLASGAIYALIAVGFGVVYNATGVFHLAHGAVVTFAAYVFYLALVVLHLWLPLACLLTVAAAAFLGCLIERLIYEPLRAKGAKPFALMIASLGFLVALQNVFAIAFGTDIRTVWTAGLKVYRLGPLTVTSLHLAVAVVALATFLLLQVFLTRSKHGRAIRALADNPALAVVIGINTSRAYLLVLALGSALAAVAAMLFSCDVGVEPDMGFAIVFLSAVAVITGGAGYLPGALLGALLLGVVQQLAIWQIDSAWQNGIVFAAVLVFLLMRPQGLFGNRLDIRKA